MERREFLKSTGAAAFTAASAKRIYGANSRVNIALIGSGGRGIGVAMFANKMPKASYTVCCDVWDQQAARGKKALGAEKTVRDFRKVLEMKDIDAVHIATPDHWHAIPTVMALDAGKHVYVEKPHGHNINEGKAMVKASKKHPELVFLTGTQHRSSKHIQKAAEILKSGKIKDVHFVRVWNCYNCMDMGIGDVPDSKAPADADWDMFVGPAPLVPFNKMRFVGTYRHFTDYSAGWITDFGVHRFDSVNQIMGLTPPKTISASGGRYAMKGMSEHPDVLQVSYEFPDYVMSYETLNTNGFGAIGRLTPGLTHHGAVPGKEQRPNGMAFYGSNATMIVDRRGLEVIGEDIPDTRGLGVTSHKPEAWTGGRIAEDEEEPTRMHAEHFVRCVTEGEKPLCDAKVGHLGTNIALLGIIAYRTGRKLHWDGEKEVFKNDPEANKHLGRKARKPWDLV